MSRQARLVPLLNGGIAAGLVVALAAIALVVNPPAPPGISEFAPKASKPITKAPQGQTRGTRSADGGCSGGVCASASARPSVAPSAVPRPRVALKGVPRALQCYEWPDGSVTQTFDSQSPPCVAAWPEADKGNGGATHRGVTGTAIRVSVGEGLHPQSPQTAMANAIVEFFNRHFQLYGRQIQLVSHGEPTRYGDPSSQRATAAKARELRAFASVHTDNSTLDSTQFLEALARNGIVGVSAYTTAATTKTLGRLAPYAWSYSPTLDTEMTSAAAFLCRAMKGRPARHSGDVQQRTRTRAFAVLVPEPASGPRIDSSPLRDLLAACGVTAGEFEYVGFPKGNDDTTGAANTQLMVDLRQRGVTTLLTIGSSLDLPFALEGASRAAYHPEWFVVPAGDHGAASYQNAAEHHRSLMGIGYWNKQLARAERLSYRAMLDVGHEPFDIGYGNAQENLYKALLLIASGIQAAGPHLTPETFAAGLRDLEFPNPEHGRAPRYQAHVGFGSSDHAMVDDFGLWFYLRSEENRDGTIGGAGGGYCWIEQGRRFTNEAWPMEEPAFFAAGARC